MKKLQIIFLLVVLAAGGISSCNEYRSFNNVTKISQLGGNPFYYKLSKGMIRNLSHFADGEGMKSAVGKLNLLSPLSSVLTNADQISRFKNSIGSMYKIAPKNLNQFTGGGTVKDLVGFVAKHGTKFPY
jgi:hypothetical protein